jgi:hypothetical protein
MPSPPRPCPVGAQNRGKTSIAGDASDAKFRGENGAAKHSNGVRIGNVFAVAASLRPKSNGNFRGIYKMVSIRMLISIY